MKITHITAKRTEALLNRILVQAEYGLTDEDYNLFICDLGFIFLRQVYPTNESMLQTFAASSKFWKWWYASYQHWESELLTFLQDHHVASDAELYKSEMEVLAHDRLTEASWNTYLKTTFRHVKL